jgi:hypothetical protein
MEIAYTNALVTYTQNGFSIRADNKINVASSNLIEKVLLHRILIIEREI